MRFCFKNSISFICDPNVDLVLFKYFNLILDLEFKNSMFQLTLY